MHLGRQKVAVFGNVVLDANHAGRSIRDAFVMVLCYMVQVVVFQDTSSSPFDLPAYPAAVVETNPVGSRMVVADRQPSADRSSTVERDRPVDKHVGTVVGHMDSVAELYLRDDHHFCFLVEGHWLPRMVREMGRHCVVEDETCWKETLEER